MTSTPHNAKTISYWERIKADLTRGKDEALIDSVSLMYNLPAMMLALFLASYKWQIAMLFPLVCLHNGRFNISCEWVTKILVSAADKGGCRAPSWSPSQAASRPAAIPTHTEKVWKFTSLHHFTTETPHHVEQGFPAGGLWPPEGLQSLSKQIINCAWSCLG